MDNLQKIIINVNNNKSDFIIYQPESQYLHQLLQMPSTKWRIIKIANCTNFYAILSHSTLGAGGIINLIERGLCELTTISIIGKDFSNFILELSCAAGTPNILNVLRTDYLIDEYTIDYIKLKKNNLYEKQTM